MFEAMDAELKNLLDHQTAKLEAQVEQVIATNESLASTMLIAEMPELGQITCERAAALTGHAPIVHDSGAMRGKRAIRGGRRLLRYVMFSSPVLIVQP